MESMRSRAGEVFKAAQAERIGLCCWRQQQRLIPQTSSNSLDSSYFHFTATLVASCVQSLLGLALLEILLSPVDMFFCNRSKFTLNAKVSRYKSGKGDFAYHSLISIRFLLTAAEVY